MHPYMREYVRRLRLLAWNEREHRLRSFFRVFVFLLIFAILFVSIPLVITPSEDGLVRSAVLRFLLVCGTVGLLLAAAVFIDKRPLHWFGLEIDLPWVVDVLIGLSIGGAIPTVAVALGFLGGWTTASETVFSPTPTYLQNIGLALVIAVCIAVVEELVFRGYVLTNAIEGLDLRWLSQPVTIATAWTLSALLFAITHPAPELLTGLHFLGVGLLLGLAYIISGQLALPIGIHAGFNLVSAYVFPMNADPLVAVVSLSGTGPTWLTGQTGLIQTGLQVPAAFVMIGYLWWRTGNLGISPEIKAKLRDG